MKWIKGDYTELLCEYCGSRLRKLKIDLENNHIGSVNRFICEKCDFIFTDCDGGRLLRCKFSEELYKQEAKK